MSRTYERANARYRFLAVVFGLVVSLGPLSLLAAALRPSGVTRPLPIGGIVAGSLLSLAPPIAAAACAIAALLLCALGLDVGRVLRVKRRAVPFGIGGVRSAVLGESTAVLTPTAIGYLHPAVIVPAEFRARVDAAEWAAVLAHESAHLARGDDWAKAIQSTLLRAGWWLPGLWVLSRALDLERELASDERAARTTGPRRYAACLLRLATDRWGDVAPGFGDRRSHVAIRVERLLRPLPGVGLVGRAAALGAFTATALAVVLGALVAVPAIAPAPVRHHQGARLALHPVPRRAVPRSGPHLTAHAKERLPRANAARPVALVVGVPVSPALRSFRHYRRRAIAPALLRPLAAHVPSVVAYTARRRCLTCFGPEHLAEDAFAPGPDAGIPHRAHVVGGGEAGTLLWIRLPAPEVNP